jgi:GT2 family glycosyltransferase
MNDSGITKDLDLSVVIVSFNTRDLLRKCLQTLERDAEGIAHETIVTDNASSDGSADMVAGEFPTVRLIRSDANLGFAGANNRGFAIARGRYVALLNSDAFPEPGGLRRSIEHMDAQAEVAVGGGRIVGSDGSWQPSARMFPSLLNDLIIMTGLASRYPKSRLWGRPDRTWADQFEPAAVDWIPGAYMIIRREVLERIGYFDERFFLYYEEVDFCRRVKAAGYPIWYWPDFVTVHLGGESAKTVADKPRAGPNFQLALWRMRAELLYYRKHHKRFGAWSAAAIETWWNRLRAWRNTGAASVSRLAKAEESRTAIALMKQAWNETRGGEVSPPRPW